jgi:hypothetical protein
VFPKGKIRTDEFPSGSPEKGYLYHLHGSIASGNTIFTLGDYFRLYKTESSPIRLFLNRLFRDYHVLFIGYGLSEFEILEFVFRPPKSNSPKKGLRHFMLIEDSGDEFHTSYLQSYYDEMNIELVPYSMDICGYDQLSYTIRKWSQQLEPAQRYAELPHEQELLQRYASHVHDSAATKGIWKLLQRPELESFFFDMLANSTYDVQRSWLRPLKKKNCFSPESYPFPGQEDSADIYWRPMGYLHAVTESAMKNQDANALNVIGDIGAGLARVPAKEPSTIFDWRTSHFVLQALMVSRKALSNSGMRQVAVSLMDQISDSSLIGIVVSDELIKLLVQQGNNVALLMALRVFLQKMLQERHNNNRHELAWDFQKTLVPHAGDFARVCGTKIISMCTGVLGNWEREQAEPSYYQVSSVEESDENRDMSYSAPMAIVRFICAACSQIPSDQRRDITRKLLRSRTGLLRRIGYYLANTYYAELSPLFWQSKRNPLVDEDAFHEVYLLLSSHAREIDSDQTEIFLHWLKKGELPWWKEGGREKAAKVSLKRRFEEKWLLSVQKSANASIQELVKKSWGNRSQPAHPEWSFHVGEIDSEWTGATSTATLQEFRTNEELAAFLRTTPVSNAYSALREMVSNDPGKFIKNGLEDLSNVPVDYLQAIFLGFLFAAQNEKSFELKSVLWLANLALDRLHGLPKKEPENEDRKGLCRSICEFVLMAEWRKIISWSEDGELVRQLVKKAVEAAQEYPVTDSDVIQSGWRQTNSAIAVAVRACIVTAANLREALSKGPAWMERVLTNALDSQDAGIRAETREGIASELWILNIVSPAWVAENLDRIFPQKSLDEWKSSFAAYLAASSIQKSLYLLLRDRGVYSFALQQDFPDEKTEQALASHVALAYIGGLDDGLMETMLARAGAGRLQEVIWYFANRNRQWTAEGRERLLQLWPKMIGAIGRLADQNDKKKLMMGLPAWLTAFQTLPGSVEALLEKSFENWIPYQSSSELDILESLARFVDKDAKRVGSILLAALNNGVILVYPDAALVTIAETLCKKGLSDVAEKIHAEYSKKGVYTLLPVLQECRKQQQSGSQVP